MERKIGEKFEYKPGIWLEVVENDSCCCPCFFDETGCDTPKTGACALSGRSDGKSVIFKQFSPTDKNNKTAELEARILRLEQILAIEPVLVENADISRKGWATARREAIDENFKKSIDKLAE